MPVFPLEGIPKEKLDSIQQEIFQYCNQIIPRYIPRMEVVDYKNEGTYLIYLWCSAGDAVLIRHRNQCMLKMTKKLTKA